MQDHSKGRAATGDSAARVLIVGAGGHGRAVAEVLLANGGFELAGFLDDSAKTPVLGYPVLGPTTTDLEAYLDVARSAIVAIGNNRVRENLQMRLVRAGFRLVTAIHPRACVAPSATIGEGCAIMAGAVVGTEASLGDGVILNIGAAVDHHCRVEAFGHLGTNASMAGGSVLGRGAWMQAGSALGYGVRVGDYDVLKPGESRM